MSEIAERLRTVSGCTQKTFMHRLDHEDGRQIITEGADTIEALVKALREARRFVEVDPTALTATVLLAQINETLVAAGRGK